MTNDAVVTRLVSDATAEVKVIRLSACGGNCGSCEGCSRDNEVRAVANNPLGAKPGQRVVVESKTSGIFGVIITVYIVPLIFFLLGYALGYLLGAKELVRILLSFLALGICAFILVMSQRNKKNSKITFDIIKII